MKNKHSKLDNITVDNLKPRQYLSDEKVNISQVKLPFKLRIRVFNCKLNFQNQQSKENLLCKIVKLILLECFVLRNCNEELKNNTKVKYDHIFGNVDFQVEANKLLSKVIITREIPLEKLQP